MSDASSRAPVAKAVDACFVIDCTWSMGGVIQAAKEKVAEIQNQICSLLGHGGNVRFAIVAYRDHHFDANIEVLPFQSLWRVSSCFHIQGSVGVGAKDHDTMDHNDHAWCTVGVDLGGEVFLFSPSKIQMAVPLRPVSLEYEGGGALPGTICSRSSPSCLPLKPVANALESWISVKM